MEALTLKAEVRQTVGKRVKNLRKQGLVPAVLYGRDQESIPLQLDNKSLARVLAEAGGHQLISLEVENQKPQMILARDIQRDVIRRNYMHVDFYAVKMDEKVTAEIPIVVEGESPAVELGGIMTQGLDALEIECLPTDLISAIPVSVDGLENFNDSILVADLKVPSSITVLSDPDSMIVKIEPPRLEEEIFDEELEEGEVSVEPEIAGAETEEEEEKEEE